MAPGLITPLCSGHRHLWQDSYEGVDLALTLPESILHQITILHGSEGVLVTFEGCNPYPWVYKFMINIVLSINPVCQCGAIVWCYFTEMCLAESVFLRGQPFPLLAQQPEARVT